MKKRFLATAVMAATMAWGAIVNAGNQNIRWTVHNLSSASPIKDDLHWVNDDTDQICIYCHTPHHAQPAQPLWNKVTPTQSFRMYTSSTTLSSAAKGAERPGPESLLCLSCHDGRTAINVLHNSSAGVDDGTGKKKLAFGGIDYDPTAPPEISGIPMNIDTMTPTNIYRSNLGKTSDNRFAGDNLMDDHPISFSYVSAQIEEGNTELHPIEHARSNGLRFFGPNRDQLECSSCHDPHMDYGMVPFGFSGGRKTTGSPTGNTSLTPFLVRDNAGSALCLACHNK